MFFQHDLHSASSKYWQQNFSVVNLKYNAKAKAEAITNWSCRKFRGLMYHTYPSVGSQNLETRIGKSEYIFVHPKSFGNLLFLNFEWYKYHVQLLFLFQNELDRFNRFGGGNKFTMKQSFFTKRLNPCRWWHTSTRSRVRSLKHFKFRYADFLKMLKFFSKCEQYKILW